MLITNLLHGLRNDMVRRIRLRRRPSRCSRQTRSASRGYPRALTVEGLEDRMLLTGFLVDTLADDPSADQFDTDGLVSLREAITAANTNDFFGDAPVGQGEGIVDSITFDVSLTDQTIVLNGTELVIADALSITGLGADRLTVSGNHLSRVFSIQAGVPVDVSEWTIADGSGYLGGGIYNEGTLNVTNSVLANNSTTTMAR